MTSEVVTSAGVPLAESRGLSQMERVVDTFLAPGKTFTDILRSASWWFPFALLMLLSLTVAGVVSKQVGFEQVQATQLHNSPKQEEALNNLPPEQKAQRMAIGVKITKVIFYTIPLTVLVANALYALILWASFNFILGASTTYPRVFATSIYASLPYVLLNLLTIVTLYFGNAENYDYKSPAGTNLAFFMTDQAPWLHALLQRLDLIQLWILGLTTYGMAIVAKKTVAQSAMVVVGWWVVATLMTVGAAAAFS